MAQTVKNLPAVRETGAQPLGWEDPLEKGMAIHSTVLAWRIPRTEATVDGLRKSWYDWGTNTFHFLLAKLWSGCWVSCVRLNPESAPSVNFLGQFVSAHCSLVPCSQLMSTLWFVFQRPRQETGSRCPDGKWWLPRGDCPCLPLSPSGCWWKVDFLAEVHVVAIFRSSVRTAEGTWILA